MKIKLIVVGKTDNGHLRQLIAEYRDRLEHYVNFELDIVPDLKNAKGLSKTQQKRKEGELILKRLNGSDVAVLLDERGRQQSSVAFADYLQKKMNAGHKRLVLVIGGPYGFSTEVYDRVGERMGLSRMTFSHQMVRLFLIEQLYRAFTILGNSPYHHA